MSETVVTSKLKDWILSQRQLFINELTQLVSIESPSTEPRTVLPVFSFFREICSKLEYHCIKLPGHKTAGQLLAYPLGRAKKAPIQLLLGHADTVWPVDTLKKMPCKVEGNVMFGPGIYDMKAGLLEFIFALRCLKELNVPCEVTPVLLITSDEEIGSSESRQNITRLAKIAERCYVTEPSLGYEAKIKTQRKGVGVFEITVHGKSAHSGLEPDKGANAILEMTSVIQKLYQLNAPEKGTTVNVGTIEGGERVNVIAAKSKITVDVRVLTLEETRRIEKAIQTIKPEQPGTRLEIKGGIDRPPMQKDNGVAFLWELAKSNGEKLGLTLEDGCSGGASDGNLTAQHCPTLDGLGAVGDGAHALHEQIQIEQTLERTALLALMIAEPPVEHRIESLSRNC